MNWKALQYWSTNDAWRSSADSLATLTELGPPETSFNYVDELQSWVFFGVDFLTTNLYMYASNSITGPYTKRLLYTIPPPYDKLPGTFCYAPKLHAELRASPDSRLFTLVCNAQNITDLLDNTNIYVPIAMKIRFN